MCRGRKRRGLRGPPRNRGRPPGSACEGSVPNDPTRDTANLRTVLRSPLPSATGARAAPWPFGSGPAHPRLHSATKPGRARRPRPQSLLLKSPFEASRKGFPALGTDVAQGVSRDPEIAAGGRKAAGFGGLRRLRQLPVLPPLQGAVFLPYRPSRGRKTRLHGLSPDRACERGSPFQRPRARGLPAPPPGLLRDRRGAGDGPQPRRQVAVTKSGACRRPTTRPDSPGNRPTTGDSGPGSPPTRGDRE